MDTIFTKITGLLFMCCVVNTSFATEHLVVQENEKFSELFLKIENKDIVRFVNLDLTKHRLSFTHRNQHSLSRDITPGSSQTVLFNKPGVYDIQCDIHPAMKMTVFVPYVGLVKATQ